MGNCLKSNKILAENEQDEPQGSCQAEVIKETEKIITASNLGGAAKVAEIKSNKKKKVVRFKLNEENSVEGGKQGEPKNGVVRIRVVVTQKELKQILSSRKDLKHSSMEQLVKVMKLRGIRVSEAGRRCDNDDDGFHGAWRPALESIPEEH
ncbi:hypothetical protein DITRI_Ditri17bG0107300 [Diplodiscus trichospermus]